MSTSDLTDAQIAAARRFYAEGAKLGTIAQRVGCSLYDLSPWLYTASSPLREQPTFDPALERATVERGEPE